MILEKETHQSIGRSFQEAKKHDMIICRCDYCGSQFKRTKNNIERSHRLVQKDSCTNRSCISLKKKDVSQFQYGTDNPFQSEDVKKKIKETNRNKYGVDNPMQNSDVQKRQEDTCLKRFGSKNVFSNKGVQERIRTTNMENHGFENAFKSPEVQAKQKETIQKKYHVSHYSKTEEYRSKVRATHQIRRGVDSNLSTEENKEKVRKTCLDKYGAPNPMQNDDVKERLKKSFIRRFGEENPMHVQEIREKSTRTCLERFGCENPSQNPEIRSKMSSTCMDRYGVSNVMSKQEFVSKARDTCMDRYGKYPVGNYGKTQKEIQEWLNGLGFNFQSDYKVLKGHEIDLLDTDIGIAIEYCGIYWHNEGSRQPRGKNYHHNKFLSCLDAGIHLLTIFSDEWESRKYQCQSHIKSVVGINERRIYARKCSVAEIDKQTGRDFFESFHIQGKNGLGKVFFGLLYEGKLVGAISLGRHHRQNCKDIVLDRLCFKDGIQIVGGASRLFKQCILWAKANGFNRIVSWSDNRWSIGRVYLTLGFQLEIEHGPDYSYVDMSKPSVRISKQSQMKKLTKCPHNLTEWEWAKQRGLFRIWDCGKKRWSYPIG